MQAIHLQWFSLDLPRTACGTERSEPPPPYAYRWLLSGFFALYAPRPPRPTAPDRHSKPPRPLRAVACNARARRGNYAFSRTVRGSRRYYCLFSRTGGNDSSRELAEQARSAPLALVGCRDRLIVEVLFNLWGTVDSEGAAGLAPIVTWAERAQGVKSGAARPGDYRSHDRCAWS